MITPRAFADSLVKCFAGATVPSKVLVALSGGVDSICMTYLLTKYQQLTEEPLQVHAVTIDHNYRKESAVEAQRVGQIVSKWGVQHHVIPLTYDRPLEQITNFELVARVKRYEEFQRLADQLGIQHILVAHNYNDQLETTMIRIQQQSTVFGLTGLKSAAPIPITKPAPSQVQHPLQVIRPLLPFTKSQIYDTCTKNDVDWFEDYTNKDIHMTKRNLFRYALTEFIPRELEKDPESPYKWISAPMIEDTIKKSKTLSTLVEDQVEVLKSKAHMDIDETNGTMEISLPIANYEQNGDLVLSRFFYQSLYRVSAIKNYHFAYTKVLHKVLPRLKEALNSPGKSIKFTSLQLYFEVKATEFKLYITVSRQPVLREELPTLTKRFEVTNEPSEWMLFDERYWLRFKVTGKSMPAMIIPYHHKKHQAKIDAQYGEGTAHKKMNLAPLVSFKNGRLAVPTFGLVPPWLQAQWYLKDY